MVRMGTGITGLINPLHWISLESYSSFWLMLFNTVLQGFVARLLGMTFLFLAFWLGVRRQRPRVGFVCFVLCVIITFGASFIKLIGGLWGE